MIKTNMIQSTWSSVKTKILCSITMFSLFAIATGIIGTIIFLFGGTVFYSYGWLSTGTVAYGLFFNFSNIFSPIFLPTIIGVALFALFFAVRNTQHQATTLGINRSSHYLSNLTCGVFYATMFTIVALICELIIRSYLLNIGHIHELGYKAFSISSICKSMFMVYAFSLMTFSTVTAIMNTLLNRRYFSILILMAIVVGLIMVWAGFSIAIDTAFEPKVSEAIYSFLLKWSGMSVIAFIIMICCEGYNYWLIRRGGLRR